MNRWTRSTAGTGGLLRSRRTPALERYALSQSSGHSALHMAVTASPRPTHPAQAAAPTTRLCLWSPSQSSSQTMVRPRILSAGICTSGTRLLKETTRPPGPDTPRHTIDAVKDVELRSLVGAPCPGCGSPFQIERPQDSGYLTRVPNEPVRADAATKRKSGSKESTKLAFDPTATSMTHAQYEGHLKSLDPKILEEMGLVWPATPMQSDSSTRQPGADAGQSQTTETITLSKKPIIQPNTPPRLVCHRCHSLSHHASPIANSTVLQSILFPSPPAPVPKHLETLAQSRTATVVLVVDLTDFPVSLPQPIVQELLKAKRSKMSKNSSLKEYPMTPIILVGNKFDVMPLGARKHRVIQVLQQYLEKHGLAENVRAIHLVSAKNPVGDEIKMLLRSIGTSWQKSGKGNVIMVGAENVGKSQLLNAFLKESGRWRPNAQQVQRQKYGKEQEERQKKLSALLGDSGRSSSKDGPTEEEDKEWAAMTGKDSVGVDMDEYEALYKDRGLDKFNTFNTTVSNVPGTTLERIKVPLSVLARFMGATYKEVQTKWLMDTPGIRSGSGQLTTLLTLEELKVALPKRMLKPASFTLEEGKSFFLGGLVRIDCISVGKTSSPGSTTDESSTATDDTPLSPPRERGSNPAPKLTVFTTLPLHKTSTMAADKFLEKSARGELTVLQPPFGSPERMAAFPGLVPVSSEDIVIINQPRSSSSFSKANYDPFTKLNGDRTSKGKSEDENLNDTEMDCMTRQERNNATLQLAGQYGICDLVFSGVGWVMISGKFRGQKQAVRLRVWTPGGEGAMVRELCFFPELAANPVEKTAGGIRQKHKIFVPLAHKTRAGSDSGVPLPAASSAAETPAP